MFQYEFFIASSLEKVFADERPKQLSQSCITALRGDTVRFQLIHTLHETAMPIATRKFCISIEGAPNGYTMRKVELVPSNVPGYSVDTNYLRSTPGMYPDLLLPFDGIIRPICSQYRSVFIDVPIQTAPAGEYRISIKVKLLEGDEVSDEICYEQELTIKVANASLPKSDIMHTEWLYTDCLANYYNVEVFSEKHWQYIENFVKYATDECCINMLYTPIFTPPLDTQIGGERLTTQLVKVTKTGDSYMFDFELLARWCDMVDKYNIEFIEISHLFTQWGATATPKIVADVDGVQQKIFGWHVPATDPAYEQFLYCFIPQLLSFFAQRGYNKNKLIFHVSDEPRKYNIDAYMAAKAVLKDMLKGYTVMDALSDVELYKSGAVDLPVPSNNHIEDFVDLELESRWVYYCISQKLHVPNRFFSMPSSRNRIMGVLMYLYKIDGFLHWGYNFYNSQFSIKPINPFINTDSDMGFSSGDPFLVYPGEDGEVLGSLRSAVLREAFDDCSALKLLESLTDRDTVVELIHSGLNYKISFVQYPMSSRYLLSLREEVNRHILSITG